MPFFRKKSLGITKLQTQKLGLDVYKDFICFEIRIQMCNNYKKCFTQFKAHSNDISIHISWITSPLNLGNFTQVKQNKIRNLLGLRKHKELTKTKTSEQDEKVHYKTRNPKKTPACLSLGRRAWALQNYKLRTQPRHM